MALSDSTHRSVRYQPDESPPPTLSLGLGFQLAAITVTGVVLMPAIVIRGAGGSELFLSWAVFAAVMVAGVTTILQAVRVGRFGAGYVLMMGTSGAFIAVCITAIAEGGPAMLATLVIISSFFQFVLATRLSLLRQILTPTVAGTVLMLIPVTVMPTIFDMLNTVPEGAPEAAVPVTALVTMVFIVGLALKARGQLRLWVPVIGVVIGSIVAGFFGIYNFDLVANAAWVGLPEGSWPGLDLSFGPVFWTLLPAFVFVTLVGAVETVGDSIAIQHVSWRKPRAVDFRAVQGAVGADGMGNLLSGLAGTVPNTTYSTSIAVVELTGVGARSVGVATGALFIALAFFPKALAVILAIPDQVVAAYVTVILALIFILGMKMIIQDGINYRVGLIAGVSFWIGTGFQTQSIFPEFFSQFAGGFLQNGITSGGLMAIILTMFQRLGVSRSSRFETELTASSLPDMREFLQAFVSRNGWDQEMMTRLDIASEETLLTLLEVNEAVEAHQSRRLSLAVRKEDGGAVLEFVATTGEENLQDQIALLGEQAVDAPVVEKEISLRLLRHVASSVLHQQYYNTDIVTVRVDTPKSGRGERETDAPGADGGGR